MKEIFQVQVVVHGSAEVKSKQKTINRVFFTGDVESDLFTGKVLDTGIDTQFIENGQAYLSARYMLEGIDKSGENCRIFIQNEGAPDNLVPMIVTDSEALAFLNEAVLSATVEPTKEGVLVTIFAVD